MTWDRGAEHAHTDEWHRFILRCKDFRTASEYAADSGWWLHCWDWEPSEWDALAIIDTYGE